MKLKRLYEADHIREFNRCSTNYNCGRHTVTSQGEGATIIKIIPPTEESNAQLVYKLPNSRLEETWYIGCSKYFGLELEDGTKYEWKNIFHGYGSRYNDLTSSDILVCYNELSDLISHDFKTDIRTEDEIQFDSMLDCVFPVI